MLSKLLKKIGEVKLLMGSLIFSQSAISQYFVCVFLPPFVIKSEQ